MKKTKDDGKPFLLYMAYNAPHWPLHAPQESIDRCNGRYDAGYDAIRNARYQRQVELGLLDPAHSAKYGTCDLAAQLSFQTPTVRPFQ